MDEITQYNGYYVVQCHIRSLWY